MFPPWVEAVVPLGLITAFIAAQGGLQVGGHFHFFNGIAVYGSDFATSASRRELCNTRALGSRRLWA
jgi:hypothetical protein